MLNHHTISFVTLVFYCKDNTVESKYSVYFHLQNNTEHDTFRTGIYELLLGKHLYYSCKVHSKLISKYE